MKIILSLLIISLIGCYSPKKANQQVGRALATYPLIAADAIRKAFPCITDSSKIDSSEYNESMERYEQLLSTVGDEIMGLYDEKDSLNKAYDSIRRNTILDSIASIHCHSLIEECDRRNSENKTLKSKLFYINHIVDSLKHSPPVLKPIVQKEFIKDMAEVFYAQEATKAALSSKDKMQDSRDTWRIIAIISLVLLIVSIFFNIKSRK